MTEPPSHAAQLREQFQAHRKECSVCADGTTVCPVGISLAAKIEKESRPQISADAQFIAGKIVKHMWIIFVLLPLVLGILFAIMKS